MAVLAPSSLRTAGSGSPPPPVEVGERGARATLRAQIERLERQLADHAADGASATPVMRGAAGARLQTLAQLEAQRDALAARISDVRRALDLRGAQHELARGRMEAIMLDPAAHPWERVTNADIGEPGCRQVHALPRFGILGQMLSWWRVRISSGCPLCMAR
jgi:hypothetical protein